ncbi:curlin subunit CsgB [Thalassomonas actiniarum]|uniref:curlin subunit CsgB n=1 Tax=Thalassomonas actiniarum TaxID=485447 RepID=UPI00236049F4|nr:curlin subunit CsgB [Thalassomonas actiniarum]
MLSTPVVCASPDLLSGTDMQESPLSLSLSTSVDITSAEQHQQLVISQYGILNKATIKQTANAANRISVSQHGNNNVLDIDQYGYGNIIALEQQGNDNQADVIQQGDANIVNVSQFGEQSIVIHQMGNEMVVNISQY